MFMRRSSSWEPTAPVSGVSLPVCLSACLSPCLSACLSVCSSSVLLRLCSAPRVLVRSHAAVSCKGFLLSGQRPAQSYIRNPGTQTAESLPGPRVHADLVNLLERFASLCSFFRPLPSLPLSLSLGYFPKESNTDMNTGLVQLLFPRLHTIHR